MKLSEIKILDTHLEYSDADDIIKKASANLLKAEVKIAQHGIYWFSSALGCYFLRKVSDSEVLGLVQITNRKLDFIYWQKKFRNGRSLPVFLHYLKNELKHPLEIAANSDIFVGGQQLLQAMLNRQPDFKIARIDKNGKRYSIKSVDEVGEDDSLLIEDIDSMQLFPSVEY